MGSGLWPGIDAVLGLPGGPGLLKVSATGAPSIGADGIDYEFPFAALGVNLLATGQTALIPARAGFKFIPRAARFRLRTLTGVQIIVPILRLGTTAGFANIAPLLATAVTVVDQVQLIPLVAALTAVDVGTNPIMVDVQTAGTGATAMTADIFLDGYYQ